MIRRSSARKLSPAQEQDLFGRGPVDAQKLDTSAIIAAGGDIGLGNCRARKTARHLTGFDGQACGKQCFCGSEAAGRAVDETANSQILVMIRKTDFDAIAPLHAPGMA